MPSSAPLLQALASLSSLGSWAFPPSLNTCSQFKGEKTQLALFMSRRAWAILFLTLFKTTGNQSPSPWSSHLCQGIKMQVWFSLCVISRGVWSLFLWNRFDLCLYLLSAIVAALLITVCSCIMVVANCHPMTASFRSSVCLHGIFDCLKSLSFQAD